MIRKMMQAAVLGVVLVATLLAVPTAQAIDDPSIIFTNARWTIACSTGMGRAAYDLTVIIPAGYTGVHRWSWGDDPIWGAGSESQAFTEPAGWYMQRSYYWDIGTPGWQRESWEIFAPSGILVSAAYFYASCATGEIRLSYSDVYGYNEPAASDRVDAVVNYDTPVYGEMSLNNPVPNAILHAGQTWFVVAEDTDTAGHVWYQVYVGGPLAWVPAGAVTLAGPVPD